MWCVYTYCHEISLFYIYIYGTRFHSDQERTRLTGKRSVSTGGGVLSLGRLFKDKRRNSTVNKKSVSRLIKSFAILFPLFIGHKLITIWLIGFKYHHDLKWYEKTNLLCNIRFLIEVLCTHLQGFVVSIQWVWNSLFMIKRQSRSKQIG